VPSGDEQIYISWEEEMGPFREEKRGAGVLDCKSRHPGVGSRKTPLRKKRGGGIARIDV